MLRQTKKDLTIMARKLAKPYEIYSIDDLANAYCDAVDSGNEPLKDIYISALVLRFWYTIDRMYNNNTGAPSLEREDFFWLLYEAIERACKYRAWQDSNKNVNAQQCINKCIETIKLIKYYELNLDKRKVVNHCYSLDTPLGGDCDDARKTIGDTLEAEGQEYDSSTDGVIWLVQSYINSNKIIEAILIDNIAFNDVLRHTKKTIKTHNMEGEDYKYVEHSSEFWPYRLIQIVSKLPNTYKKDFLNRYVITEDKLTAILDIINRANNQKLYRYLDKTLEELRVRYANNMLFD